MINEPTANAISEHVATAVPLSTLEELNQKLISVEDTLTELRDLLLSQQKTKDWYSTAEVAAILGKKPYTVREWCRLGRVHASKTMSGRGSEEEWRISHEELVRIQNDGLLPIRKRY